LQAAFLNLVVQVGEVSQVLSSSDARRSHPLGNFQAQAQRALVQGNIKLTQTQRTVLFYTPWN
jgi:hypothetical protein